MNKYIGDAASFFMIVVLAFLVKFFVDRYYANQEKKIKELEDGLKNLISKEEEQSKKNQEELESMRLLKQETAMLLKTHEEKVTAELASLESKLDIGQRLSKLEQIQESTSPLIQGFFDNMDKVHNEAIESIRRQSTRVQKEYIDQKFKETTEARKEESK